MPEGPEVEVVRISLESKALNKKIVKTEVFHEKVSEKAIIKILRKQKIEDFINNTENYFLKEFKRRAKFLILTIEKEKKQQFILIHLGMSGKVIATKSIDNLEEKIKKHIIVQFTLSDGTFIIYSDMRRFGKISTYSKEEFLKLDNINQLGPEVDWENADNVFLENIRSKKKYLNKPIKDVIMDQNVVSGVGNIYACEALWAQSIHPFELTKDLSDKQLISLFNCFKEILKFSISVGGSSIRDYVNGVGKEGEFQKYLNAYGQVNCPVCLSYITKDRFKGKGRSAYYCLECQKKTTLDIN